MSASIHTLLVGMLLAYSFLFVGFVAWASDPKIHDQKKPRSSIHLVIPGVVYPLIVLFLLIYLR